ncbi:MAG: glycosyltransferase family 87 protein [Terriglobales bacterium]
MTTVPASSLLQFRPWKWLLLSIVCAAGVWLYAERVLVSYQIADAAAHDRPRGNLSDLYPRWVGARELLLHGRDPYSSAVTREIQTGYYGRSLDSARPGDPKDQQGFAYPVYVIFYLAPTVRLPFAAVQRGFFWVLLGLTVATVPLWLRMLRWSLAPWAQVSVVALTVGSLAAMQGLKLQQMTLFVVGLVAMAMALLAADCAIAAGILLALATIKPQLVGLLLFWLAIWTVGDWRRRYRWAASFLLTMVVLFAASEWWLPHWIPRFLQAVREYRSYTDAVSVLDKLVPAPWGMLLRILAAAATLHVSWKNRRFAEETHAFAATASLVLAVTVIVIPSYALYNQVMLLPAVLLLVRERQSIWDRSFAARGLVILVAVLLFWPWLASAVLAGLSFLLPPEVVQRAWAVPGWTALSFPAGVAALMLAHGYQRAFAAPPGPKAA